MCSLLLKKNKEIVLSFILESLINDDGDGHETKGFRIDRLAKKTTTSSHMHYSFFPSLHYYDMKVSVVSRFVEDVNTSQDNNSLFLNFDAFF